MKINFFLIFFPILLNSSCEKVVQEEFSDFPEKLVINSHVIDNMPIQVYVSLTKKLDKTPLEGLNNAIVNLYEEGRFIESLTYCNKGIYKASALAKEGRSYNIEVEVEGFSKKTLQVKIPQQQKILNITHLNDAGVDKDGHVCPAFKITFTNNPHKKEYFQIRADFLGNYYNFFTGEENDKSSIYRAPAYIFDSSDPILLSEGLPILVFSNEKIKDSVYTMYVEYSTDQLKNVDGVIKYALFPLSIELQSIDSAYYCYLKSSYLYDRGRFETGIGEAYGSYQLFSNIPDGYGIVAAYAVDKYDTIFPERK